MEPGFIDGREGILHKDILELTENKDMNLPHNWYLTVHIMLNCQITVNNYLNTAEKNRVVAFFDKMLKF